jgi:hypothetical protein
MPQLATFVVRSTHDELQATCGAVQLAEQAPLLQTVPPEHALPHVPQFAALDLVSTHVPLQSTCGLVHVVVPPRRLSVLASELQLEAANNTATRPNNRDTTLFPASWR